LQENTVGKMTFVSESCYISSAKEESDKDRAWKNYIFPARNLVLAAIGSQYSDTVWIVANKRSDESVGTPDKTSRFFRETTDLLSDFYGRLILVKSPLLNQSKLEAVQDYLKKGGSVQALKATFSCYSPTPGENEHCGKCLACYKRYKLFQALNVEVNFHTFPPDGENFLAYEKYEKSKGR
jgi:7-cyano-7-deazaguanine synthase in queuosine biosynthesis